MATEAKPTFLAVCEALDLLWGLLTGEQVAQLQAADPGVVTLCMGNHDLLNHSQPEAT